MYRTVFWTLWERESVGWFERMASKHVYHIRNQSLVQVQCRIQDAWGWCTAMTQRDDMRREVGGGFRMGNMCIPVVDSCWCMAKPIQYCNKPPIKINKFILKNKNKINKFKFKNCKNVYLCITELLCYTAGINMTL